MWSILLLGLMAVFASVSGEIQLIIDDDTVPAGTDVAIHCRVSGMESGALITWYKRQGENKDPTTVALSTFVVDEAFKKTGRFSLLEEKEEGSVRFIMNIAGVKSEDSGEYGCALSSAVEDKHYGMLSVIAPVESVKLVPISPFDNIEHELPIKEGESYHMMCDIEGGMPAAEVKITLAGKDITSRFDKAVTQMWKTNPDESITNAALGIMSYNTKMTSNEPFKVPEGADDLYNREDLICEAFIPSQEGVSDKLELVFMVAPKVTCKGAFVPFGERNVRIICTIQAEPKPNNHNVTWSWIDPYGNYSLTAGEETPDKKVKFNELKQGQEEDEYIAELFFPRVYLHHFTTYTMHVANIVGNETAEVKLLRDNAGEVGGGASGITASLTLLGLTIMAAMFRGL